MKKNNLLIIGAIAIGAYLIYNKMNKSNNKPTGNQTNPTPVSNTEPSVGKSVKDFKCPTKEKMARTRYTKEGMEQLRAMGCI